MQFDILHGDHGITDDQWEFIKNQLVELDHEGFFIQKLILPAKLGTVPCGIHGPCMGDDPVPRSEVEMVKRGEPGDKFRWLDPIVDRAPRPVDHVQVIGIRAEPDLIRVFTCYGGPLAPQNPEDPGNPDVEAAKKFWSAHALSRPS